MSRPLIFVGSRQDIAGVAQIAEFTDVEILGILDHHYYGNTNSIANIPIIGDERTLLDPNNVQAQQWLKTCDFFPINWWNGSQSMGNNNTIDLSVLRLQRIELLEKSGANIVNLIHPNAKVNGLRSKYIQNFNIGRGLLIDDNCWISSNDVTIGDYCQISIGVNIGHTTHLGKNTTIAPWSALTTHHIGINCFIGMHSKTDMLGVHKYGILEIGDNCTIWANSLIGKHIPNNSIYTSTNRIFKKYRRIE